MFDNNIFAALAAFALVAGYAPCHAAVENSAPAEISMPAETPAPVEKPAPTGMLERAAAAAAAPAPPTQAEPTLGQKTRYHNIHYHFGHKLLPEFVYRHSINFRESIEGSDTEFPEGFGKFLIELWNGMWGDDPPKPVGLNSEIINVSTGTNATDKVSGFLITFPEPPQSPDNYFAFVFVDKNMNLRYLTYEKSISFGEGNDKTAVLCGWNPNGSRANYALSGGITRDEFITVLRPFLTKESPAIQAWNPSGGEVEN